MAKDKNYKGMVSEVDPIAIRKLYYEYRMTNQEISNMTWETKANINKILNQGIKYYNPWIEHHLTEQLHQVFEDMLKKHIFNETSDDLSTCYLIKNNSTEKICFIWYDADSVHCLFDEDISLDLKTLAHSEHMDIYNELDYKVLEISETDSILKEPHIALTQISKKLFTKASRVRKMSSAEYANFLGFKGYLTERDTNRDSKIINFLEEHIIDGLVYLSSSPENQWIRNYASRCGMSLEDFLDYYGYKKSKYDYNYVSQRKNEKYKNELKKYIVENPNTVYISSQEPIYQTLYNIAQQNNMTLDDYIQLLGYTRSKGRNSLIELSGEINKILSVENEKIEKKISSNEKIKRNHLLINRLKEFYSYECQLCTENQKMTIQKKDGTKYVEVHHIKNLSEEYDEEGTLDRLNNLIVVCPNHHKMLHYHNGGYRKIVKTNNGLAFTNDSSDIIPIVHNKHLTSNE